MSLSSTIRALISAGGTPEMILAIVEADEKERNESDKIRLKKDAERTQRYRNNGGGNISKELRESILERDNYSCRDCCGKESLQIDHIYPVSRGGVTEYDNLQVLCRSCNARKKDRVRKRNSRDVHGQNFIPSESSDIPLNGSDGFPDPSLNLLKPHKENTPKGVQKKNPKDEVLLPDWLPLAEWDGFKEMRNKIKKPMTPRAERMAIGKLEDFRAKGHDPTEILNQSTFSDYQDLYEPKGKSNENHSRNTPGDKPKWISAADAYIAKHSQPGG